MQVGAINSFKQVNFSGKKHNKKENLQSQPVIINSHKGNPFKHLAAPVAAFMILVPGMSSCEKDPFEPINAHAHVELTPEVWEKNANLAIHYLNNPDSLKARLTPEELQKFYQITKTEDNIPVKYFLGQQGLDGRVSAYIRLGNSESPVRINPAEDIKANHVVNYIREVNDTLKTTDEKIEYSYKVVEGEPKIVIGDKVVLEILKTDDIKNKSIVDYINLLEEEKPATYSLDNKDNIKEKFDDKYIHTYGEEMKLDSLSRVAINKVVNFFGAKLGSKDLITHFATTDSDKGSIEKLMIGLTSENLDEAEIKFNFDGHEFVGIPQFSKDGKTVKIGDNCKITKLDDTNMKITVNFKACKKNVSSEYNIKKLCNGEFEVMRKGDSYEEIIHHKGDIDSSKVIHHKGDIDYNNIIHHKGDIDSSKVIHHKGDIDYSKIIHHKGDIDSSKVIHHKGDIDYSKIIHRKGDIDSSKVIHHKGDIDYSKVIHHKGDIDYSKVIHRKGDIDSSKVIHHKGDIDYSKVIHRKGDIDSSKVIHHKGDIDYSKVIHHKGDIDYSKIIHHKGDPDYTKPIYDIRYIPRDVDPSQKQFVDNVAKFFGRYSQDEILTHIKMGDDSYGNLYKGLELNFNDKTGQIRISIGEYRNLEVGKDCTFNVTNAGISIDVNGKKFFIEDFDGKNFNIIHPNGVEENYPIKEFDTISATVEEKYIKGYEKYDHDEYGRYDHDEYGRYDHDEYGRYDHDEYGRYDHDEYGRYDHDEYGRYDHDEYGRYDHDEYGKYDQDEYGRYDHDEYGRYCCDEFGRYDHDVYGRYCCDEFGRYDHDEYGTYDHDVTRTVDKSVTENIKVKCKSKFDTERIEKADKYVDTNRQVLIETRKTAREYYEIKKRLIEDVRDKAGHDYDLLQSLAVDADATANIGF